MNPAQKALWYIESHLAGPLTLDEIAAIGGVSRFHMVRAFASATGFSVMRYVRARRLTRRRARWPTAADISVWRWMRITALTKHSPARSATISASRPKRSAPQRASGISSFRSRSSWTSTLLDNLKAPRFETGKPCSSPASANAILRKRGRPFRASGSAFISRSTAFPQGSERSPMASAATATIPGISTTSPASRSPTSPTCRADSPTCGYPSRIRGVHPRRAHLDHSPHRQHDLESLAAGVGHEGCRRAELRALRREVRSVHRQWRPRDLDTREGVGWLAGWVGGDRSKHEAAALAMNRRFVGHALWHSTASFLAMLADNLRKATPAVFPGLAKLTMSGKAASSQRLV